MRRATAQAVASGAGAWVGGEWRVEVEGGAGSRSWSSPSRAVTPAGRSCRWVWPVRSRKTSSSVGRRSAMSSTATPRSSRARTAASRLFVAGVDRRRPRVRVAVVDPWRLGAEPREGGRDGGEVGGVAGVDLDDVAPGLALQLARCARGDHAAVVDDDDLAGELVGLVEVLRREQHVGAARATRARMASHSSMRLRGSRPVVGSSSSSRRGEPTRLAPRSSRRRMPPE